MTLPDWFFEERPPSPVVIHEVTNHWESAEEWKLRVSQTAYGRLLVIADENAYDGASCYNIVNELIESMKADGLLTKRAQTILSEGKK